MNGAPGFIEVVRGDVVESRHRVHVVVVAAGGRTLACAGNPELVTYFRSSAKPLQALPLVEDGVVDGLAMSASELALCCASHGGEPGHVTGVRRLLARAGIPEEALECGAHAPMHSPSAQALLREGAEPLRIHNNCSGKHAGMLALAAHHGWPLEGYARAEHPVQRRMLSEVARWSGRPERDIGVGIDGCGVACFALPLRDMAVAYARFSASAAAGGATGPVVAAMTEHPWEVAGSERLCTALMEAAGGRLFAKVGAEGVYGLGIPERGLGVALKVEDGGWRAAEVALLAVLDRLDERPERGDALLPWSPVRLRNTAGAVVGELRADLSPRFPDAGA